MATNTDLKDYYVLLMAATSLGPISARNEHDAILIARHKATELIDPKQVAWIVKTISDKPFEIADPGAEEPAETPPEQPRILSL